MLKRVATLGALTLTAVLLSASTASAEPIPPDFVVDNVLNPLINEVYNNAVGMFGSALSSALSSIFSGI